MSKKIIQTDKAPGAIGPYSQGVEALGLIFFSGQIPIDVSTGELVKGGIEAETKEVLKNMEALLASVGKTFEDVIKTTIFLTDLSNFGTVNTLYGEKFTKNPPSRSTVQVSALPKGAQIEIEFIVEA